MTLRLIAFCVLLPGATLAQQSTPSGECESKRCPEGQIMDSATKSCIAVSA